MMRDSNTHFLATARFVVAALLSILILPAGAPAQEPAFEKLGPLPPIPPMPVSPSERAEADGTALPLSLMDLAKLALQHNLDIAISNLNEEFNRQAIIQARGAYDPLLSAAIGTYSQKNANTNLATRSLLGNFNKFDIAVWNFQFQQSIKTGGSITASYNSNRINTNQSFSLFNPQFNTAMTLSVAQPLLRNFRIDQNRANIQLADLDFKTNDSQSKQKIVTAIAAILGQYWDLVGAIQDYEIKRESVRLAQITLRDNKRRLELGALPAIAVTEARAMVAQREVDLLSAEERIYVLENALRALISEDRKAEIWGKFIIPTEKPDYQEFKIDLDTAIDAALKNRPELEQLDLGIQKYDLYQRLGSNLRKWQIDLTASFGTTGVAGPQSYVVDPFTGVQQIAIDPKLVGAVGKANRLLFTGGFANWSVGFDLKIPLRNRGVEAQLAQIRVGKRQQLMRRSTTEQQVRVEVSNAFQAIETNRKQIETARVALRLASQQLWGEERRFQGGVSPTFMVLKRQEELSAARGTELQALIAHKKSIISLQKAMNTLLESDNFEVVKTGAGYSLREK